MQRQCKPRHAWALTIHKSQGSETDSVLYSVSDSGYETWRHVYTAVTRGKKRVVILGGDVPRKTAFNEASSKFY